MREVFLVAYTVVGLVFWGWLVARMLERKWKRIVIMFLLCLGWPSLMVWFLLGCPEAR